MTWREKCLDLSLHHPDVRFIGDIGNALAEKLAEANFSTPKRFKRIGIPDGFPDKEGSQATLLARYGSTAEGSVAEVRKLLGR